MHTYMPAHDAMMITFRYMISIRFYDDDYDAMLRFAIIHIFACFCDFRYDAAYTRRALLLDDIIAPFHFV